MPQSSGAEVPMFAVVRIVAGLFHSTHERYDTRAEADAAVRKLRARFPERDYRVVEG